MTAATVARPPVHAFICTPRSAVSEIAIVTPSLVRALATVLLLVASPPALVVEFPIGKGWPSIRRKRAWRVRGPPSSLLLLLLLLLLPVSMKVLLHEAAFFRAPFRMLTHATLAAGVAPSPWPEIIMHVSSIRETSIVVGETTAFVEMPLVVLVADSTELAFVLEAPVLV